MANQQMLHANHRYLVVGLGLTGFSVARYLMQRGYACVVQDDRPEPPYEKPLLEQFPQAMVIKTPLTEQILTNVECLVVSPGVSVRTSLFRQAAQSGKRIIGDIELFAEAVDKPVIGITGSNGKSTVTSLLAEMIRADGKRVGVGGNIGVPALDLLDQPVDYYVLELSSFQLETTLSLQLQAATVLNVCEDHMDRYNGLADYRQAKLGIYRHARYCISNADDELTSNDASDIQFSLVDQAAEYSVVDNDGPWLAVAGEAWISAAELKLKGRHNWANCLAAMALARACGTGRPAIIDALRSFTGLPHRGQWVARINGAEWINDSKATNPGAVKAAISGLDAPVVLLAGGQSKGADMAILCDTLKQHVKAALLYGEDAQSIADAWQGSTSIECLDDLEQAVAIAHQIAQPGDVVLLSPACASFDQFSGFAERGQRFCRLVEVLK